MQSQWYRRILQTSRSANGASLHILRQMRGMNGRPKDKEKPIYTGFEENQWMKKNYSSLSWLGTLDASDQKNSLNSDSPWSKTPEYQVSS